MRPPPHEHPDDRHMNRKTPGRQAAFTLVELLIVLAILALLAAIAVPMYSKYATRVKIAKAEQFLAETSMLLVRYHQNTFTYPATLSEIGISEPVLDPWGNPYRYLPIDINPPPNTGHVRRDKNMNPINTDYDLYSAGPDGRTQTQLMAKFARDDIVRASNGSYIGVADDF